MKGPKILYFIEGASPSETEVAHAKEIGTGMFRNGLVVPAEGALEDCDFVAGRVPKRYAEAFKMHSGQRELPLEAAPFVAAAQPELTPAPATVAEAAPSPPMAPAMPAGGAFVAPPAGQAWQPNVPAK